jgi:hypothetical protein
MRVNDFDYLDLFETFQNHYFQAAPLKYRDRPGVFAAKQQLDENVQYFIVRVNNNTKGITAILLA